MEDKKCHFHRQLVYGRDNEFQTPPRVTGLNENCRNKLHVVTPYNIMKSGRAIPVILQISNRYNYMVGMSRSHSLM